MTDVKVGIAEVVQYQDGWWVVFEKDAWGPYPSEQQAYEARDELFKEDEP